MTKYNRNSYLEQVSHITKAQPYAIYRTIFLPENSQALYRHIHPEFEFFYLESGKLEFYIEETQYILEAGEGIFVPGNLLHYAHCASSEGGVFYAIVFSPEYIISSVEKDIFGRHFPPALLSNPDYILPLKKEEEKNQPILDHLREIFSASQIKEDMYLYIRGLMLLIWQDLYQNDILKLRRENKEKEYRDLQPVIQYIHEHYMEEISLDELARLSNMSTGYFCRLFKKITSYTPFS
ncbi:MAG: AraC family transcriptional regulator, partial [Eubacterium sp.]|nr:AraC family transcriptional regulator [Eubacterium sp.]